MTFKDHPRLIGPIQRGTSAWQRLYGARSASERANKAFRFAGAIRTLAQLLRRAMNFVLDVSYTRGKSPATQT
jgi:hypothetical protein